MTWAAVFVVFFVSHQVGDFILQTDWQARNKRGGLGRNREARRALFSHVFVYTATFVPAFIWISSQLGWTTLVLPVAIAVPHLIQDDGALIQAYARRYKGIEPADVPVVMLMVDQAWHWAALFGTALLVSALL